MFNLVTGSGSEVSQRFIALHGAADADVTGAIDFCNLYAAEIRVLGKPARTQILAGETNVQYGWPRGVDVVIPPWNFPLAILCGLASAVVGVNTVLLKPAIRQSGSPGRGRTPLPIRLSPGQTDRSPERRGVHPPLTPHSTRDRV